MPKTLLFTGGGTSGHLLPLLTVLSEVERLAPEVRCVYVGSRSDISSTLLNQHPALERVESFSGKLHRYPTLKQVGEIVRLGRGLAQADQLVRKISPDVVFAKGGAITVPIVLAAARQHRVIFSHESDVRAGLANRIAARFATTVFTSYPPENYPQLNQKKLQFTGQPVRPEFFQQTNDSPIIDGYRVPKGLPSVLVLGGSQGAHQLNALVSEQWAVLLAKCSVIHQSGARDYQQLAQQAAGLPEALRKRLLLIPFIGSEMAAFMQSAALVVSRSGGTVAELAASGAAALLIPLPSSAQNHQWANAEVFRRAGAAMVIDETGLTSATLAHEVLAALDDPRRLATLREQIHGFAKPDATHTIAQTLIAAL